MLLLVGLAAFVLLRDRKARLNQYFSLTSLSLLGWVGTLFTFRLTLAPHALLWIGRANFAAVVFVALFAYLFVRQLAGRRATYTTWLWSAALVLAAATMFTPIVDRSELVRAGQHVTVYGPLFPLYLLEVAIFLAGAVVMAFRPLPRTPAEVRGQLRLVGTGILATSAIAIVTNAVLPFWLDNFALIHIGTVSTILFLLAVGSAVFVHHLFDVHLVIRATFVYAGLVTLALEVYRVALDFLAHLAPLGDPAERAYAATLMALVLNAFTQEPVRKWLERVIDRALRRRRSGKR
jgi:hypothetical protein